MNMNMNADTLSFVKSYEHIGKKAVILLDSLSSEYIVCCPDLGMPEIISEKYYTRDKKNAVDKAKYYVGLTDIKK